MIREIVLDTETTGLKPLEGDRVVEIGCVELINHIPTGQHWHVYINPQRDMPPEAFAVHGLSEEFLADKPVFSAIAGEFAEFVGEAGLVIHNAAFDLGFLNAELARLEHPPIDQTRVIDTLALARRRHPAGPNSLDALCRRYGIDNSARTLHGALLDAELLAEVYLELMGGRQTGLDLGIAGGLAGPTAASSTAAPARQRPQPLPSRLNEAEKQAHAEAIAALGAQALWHKTGSGS
jgi:DNA polymerase-3 subunit epsilon